MAQTSHSMFPTFPSADGWKAASWRPRALFYEFQLNGPTPDRVLITLKDPFSPCSTRSAMLRDRIGGSCPTLPLSKGISRLSKGERRSRGEHVFQPYQDGEENPGAGWSAGVPERKWSSGAPDGYRAFWAQLPGNDPDFADFHSFEWLRDILSDAAEPHFARAVLKGWLAENTRHTPAAWTPGITAMRLINLIRHSDRILERAGLLFRSRLLSSMARQARHLARITAGLGSPIDRVVVPIAICCCGLAFPGYDGLERQGRVLLKRELRLNVSDDGAHASRNPSAQLRLVLLLLALADAYGQRHRQVPSFLTRETGRMLEVLDFFRDADGHLPVFNGGFEDDRRAVVAAFEGYRSVNAPDVGSFIKTGYQKLQSARTRILVDVGAGGTIPDANAGVRWKRPPRSTLQNMCFDSIGSFQFSHAGQQIVVNCGSAVSSSLATSARGGRTDWQKALRQAPAHSKLSVEPADATADAGVAEPPVFSCREAEHGRLVEIEQVILSKPGPLTYKRRLFLHVDGDDFRGEEIIGESRTASFDAALDTRLDIALGRFADRYARLSAREAGQDRGSEPLNGVHRPQPALAIRFHLHPSVRASLSRDCRSVILTTAERTGWRFSSNCSTLSLDESVYAGIEGRRGRSVQIVLTPGTPPVAGTRTVNWRFSKL